MPKKNRSGMYIIFIVFILTIVYGFIVGTTQTIAPNLVPVSGSLTFSVYAAIPFFASFILMSIVFLRLTKK